jgi:hypothetical protein
MENKMTPQTIGILPPQDYSPSKPRSNTGMPWYRQKPSRSLDEFLSAFMGLVLFHVFEKNGVFDIRSLDHNAPTNQYYGVSNKEIVTQANWYIFNPKHVEGKYQSDYGLCKMAIYDELIKRLKLEQFEVKED